MSGPRRVSWDPSRNCAWVQLLPQTYVLTLTGMVPKSTTSKPDASTHAPQGQQQPSIIAEKGIDFLHKYKISIKLMYPSSRLSLFYRCYIILMTMVSPTKCLTRKLHQSYINLCSNGKEKILPDWFYEASVHLILVPGNCVLRNENYRPVFFTGTDVNIINKIHKMGLSLSHVEVIQGVIYTYIGHRLYKDETCVHQIIWVIKT